jgi:hypothetical protein
MRSVFALSFSTATVLALAACGGPHTYAAPQPKGAQPATLGAAPTAPPPNALANASPADGQETPEQLEAKARAAEAEADRLLAQNGQGGSQSAPPADNGGGGGLDGSHQLGASNEKLNSGQYYETISFNAEAGQLYQLEYTTQGYTAAVVVLNGANQVVSRSLAGPRSANHISDEIRPDSAGAWHILLTSAEPGATGQFTVQLMKMTERSLN